MEADWKNIARIDNNVFVCGFCGTKVTSQEGYYDGYRGLHIWICPCGRPTYFDESGHQYPGYPFGNKVEGIDAKEVGELYEEARRCTSAQAYTAAVLACRKLLMHIAVEKGAQAGKPFIEYVEYLSDNHYVPTDAKEWVDQIRKRGNEANHEIVLMTQKDTEELIGFTEMLLRFIYEFPHKIGKSKT